MIKSPFASIIALSVPAVVKRILSSSAVASTFICVSASASCILSLNPIPPPEIVIVFVDSVLGLRRYGLGEYFFFALRPFSRSDTFK